MSRRNVVARLRYLSSMISKYSHRWCRANGADPSARLCNWVDEYNDLRDSNKSEWLEYCATYGFEPSHTAYDVLA